MDTLKKIIEEMRHLADDARYVGDGNLHKFITHYADRLSALPAAIAQHEREGDKP